MNMKLIVLAAASMLAAMPAFAQAPLFFQCHVPEWKKDYYYRVGPNEFFSSKPILEDKAARWNENNQCTDYGATCTFEKGVLNLRDRALIIVFDTNTGIFRMGSVRTGVLDETLNCTRLAAPPK